MAQDTRKDPRAKVLSMTVRYKSATVDEFIEHHSHDVSRGGIFIKTQTPFLPGTLLKFEIRIVDDNPMLMGVGRVVWKREQAVSSEKPAGMGVKFIKLDEPSRALLDRLVSSKPNETSAFESGLGSNPPGATTLPRSGAPSPAPIGNSTAAFGSSGAALRRTMVGVAPKAGVVPVGPSPATPQHGMFPAGSSAAELPPMEERTVMRQARQLLEEAMRGTGSSMADVTPPPATASSSPSPNEAQPQLSRPNLRRTMIGVPAPAGGAGVGGARAEGADNESAKPARPLASQSSGFDSSSEVTIARRTHELGGNPSSLSSAPEWEDEAETQRREVSEPPSDRVATGSSSPPAPMPLNSARGISGFAGSGSGSAGSTSAVAPAAKTPSVHPSPSSRPPASSPSTLSDGEEKHPGGRTFLYVGLVAAVAVVAFLVWGEKPAAPPPHYDGPTPALVETAIPPQVIPTVAPVPVAPPPPTTQPSSSVAPPASAPPVSPHVTAPATSAPHSAIPAGAGSTPSPTVLVAPSPATAASPPSHAAPVTTSTDATPKVKPAEDTAAPVPRPAASAKPAVKPKPKSAAPADDNPY